MLCTTLLYATSPATMDATLRTTVQGIQERGGTIRTVDLTALPSDNPARIRLLALVLFEGVPQYDAQRPLRADQV